MLEPVVKPRRGRPRKSRDDDYAEKRKSQVRHAQRTFQIRKREALEGQRERLALLESAVEQMSSVFLDFTNYIASCKAYSTDADSVNELHKATRRMLDLAVMADVRPSKNNSQEATRVGPDGVASDSRNSEHHPHADLASADLLEVEASVQEGPGTGTITPADSTTLHARDSASVSPGAEALSLRNVFGNGWFGQTPKKYWKFDLPIGSKHVNHSSLGSRLLQATLRQAYESLLDSLNRPNMESARMFRFSLIYHTKDEILFNLRWFLGPGLRDIHRLFDASVLTLEDPGAPTYEGPQRAIGVLHPLVDTEAWSTFRSELPTELIDRGNELDPFFSVRDVEGYLLGRGARYLGDDLMELAAVDAGNAAIREVAQESFDALPSELNPPSDVLARPQRTYSKPSSHVLRMFNFSSIFEATEHTESWNFGNTFQVRMSLLLHNLTRISVCLMRGPGYHRKWINEAIMASIVHTPQASCYD